MNLIGVDAFVCSKERPAVPEQIGAFRLKMIANRGTRVWPPPAPEVEAADWWCCRYLATGTAGHADVEALLRELSRNFTWTLAQKLFEINGAPGFSNPY